MFEPLLSRFTSCWTCPIPPFEQAQSKRLRYSDEPSTQKPKLCRAFRIMVLICQDLLMEDILHQLGCVKPCKPFYKLPTSTSSPYLAISSTVLHFFLHGRLAFHLYQLQFVTYFSTWMEIAKVNHQTWLNMIPGKATESKNQAFQKKNPPNQTCKLSSLGFHGKCCLYRSNFCDLHSGNLT